MTADLCNQFGFNERFFERVGGYGPESEYGLHLHVQRCQSVIGSQVYKAKFYIDIMPYFYIDDEFCDGLALYPEMKQRIATWYEKKYKEMISWRKKANQ